MNSHIHGSQGYPDAKDTAAVTLHWRDIGDNANISGYTKSGQLFAFLSSTPALGGVARSTKLLREIAGLKLNQSRPCRIYLSGTPLTNAAEDSNRRFSYIENHESECLYQSLTVLETLSFSFELRAGHIEQMQQTEMLVMRFLTDMGLKDWAELQVAQLLPWQRRVLLLATECVAGKDTFFLDLPADDLDASSALSLITALQRAARGHRLIAISANSLSFREYAMLDCLQILSSNGSVYFGPGAGAMDYFAQMGRTPSSGASVTDFIFDIVNDAYDDVSISSLEDAACIRSRELVNRSLKQCDDDAKAMLANVEMGEALMHPLPMTGFEHTARTYGSLSQHGSETENHRQWNSETSAMLQSPNTPTRLRSVDSSSFASILQNSVEKIYSNITSPSASEPASASVQFVGEVEGEEGPSEHSLGSALDHVRDYVQNRHFDESDLQCNFPGRSRTARALMQLCRCILRFTAVRYRNSSNIFSAWFLSGFQVLVGLGFVFYGCDESSGTQRTRAVFLTILPFVLILLANSSHEHYAKDRIVFAFEMRRSYYIMPFVSPIAALLVDVLIFHSVIPCIVASLLYPVVGLQKGWSKFSVYVRTVTTMCILGTCACRAISSVFAHLSGSSGIKENRLVVLFMLTLQWLFNGIMLPVREYPWAKAFSFFYWGSNLILFNELGDDSILKEYDLAEEDSSSVGFALFLLLIVFLTIYAYVSSVRV